MQAFTTRLSLVCLASAVLLTAGCVTLDPWVKKHDTPPTGQVQQIAVTWDKTIAFVPDFTHAGTPNPGLLGRMYLFGADGATSLMGDGPMVVELYDDTPLAAGGQSVLKEKWNFDQDTLKGCMRKDLIGWGYTFFLPWGTYSPEIRQVHMMVRYTPQAGVPLFSPSQTMALVHPESVTPQLAHNSVSPDNRGTHVATSGSQSPQFVAAKQ